MDKRTITMNHISRVLIANRGEIAVRIIRSLREMGIYIITIHSDQDAEAMHVKESDEAYSLGEGSLADTYLNIQKIIQIARHSGVDAIHPGYGFLSENPEFAEACTENQIIFMGPSASSIKTMGNKLEAARFVSALDIPLMELKTGTIEELIEQTDKETFPVMIKAAAGGGGKGMRIVREPSKLREALESTSREAMNYFGNSEVYIEKYLENPKHIEIQILGDNHGNYIHLNERECSVQRRHQKIIEEAPSPSVNNYIRERMGLAALKIAEAIKYRGAGTVEFLLDEDKNFHFLEMNTRIQVEHPVTELTTGIDIVKEQLRIAQNQPLSWEQEDVKINGHAIEARIYAEDPMKNFLPSPGKISYFYAPEAQNFRLDTGVRSGDRISSEYDPIIAKAIAWNENRDMAISTLKKNLDQFIITGIGNNLKYLSELLYSEQFRNNTFTTNLIDQNNNTFLNKLKDKRKRVDKNLLAAAYIFIHSYPDNPDLKEPAWSNIGYWRPFMNWNIQFLDDKRNVVFTRHNNILEIETNETTFRVNLVTLNENNVIIENEGKKYNLPFSIDEQKTSIIIDGFNFRLSHENYEEIIANKKFKEGTTKNGEIITSPMFGKVVNINVKKDMKVNEGQTLMILEAMKMENNILADHDAIIKNIAVKEGQQVEDGQVLIEIYDN